MPVMQTKPKGKSNLLRGGHAPGFLRGLLGEALENSSPDSWVEALDDELGENHIWGQHLPHWMSMTKTQRAFWLTSNLWHCICILPLSTSVKNVFFLFRPRLAAGEVEEGRESWVKCDQPRLHYRLDATYPPVATLSAKSMHMIDSALMDYLGLQHPRSNL